MFFTNWFIWAILRKFEFIFKYKQSKMGVNSIFNNQNSDILNSNNSKLL